MTPELPTWISGLVTLAWFVVDLCVAAAAFYRFRATATGLLLGGSFLLLALGGLAVAVANTWVLADAAWNSPGRMMATFGYSALSLLCGLTIAIGIALIPESLRRLSR